MAQLLNVSIRKYTEWERGISLMAPWVEDEILRLSKIRGRDLQAQFKKEEMRFSPQRFQRHATFEFAVIRLLHKTVLSLF